MTFYRSKGLHGKDGMSRQGRDGGVTAQGKEHRDCQAVQPEQHARSCGRLPSKAGSPQACSVTSLTPGPKALGNKHSNFDHSGYFHLQLMSRRHHVSSAEKQERRVVTA